MLYKVYTEDLKRREIEVIISKYFKGFTIASTTGFWELQREQSIVIDIVANGEDVIACNAKIKDLCLEIKSLNKQESVLVVSTPATVAFL